MVQGTDWKKTALMEQEFCILFASQFLSTIEFWKQVLFQGWESANYAKALWTLYEKQDSYILTVKKK